MNLCLVLLSYLIGSIPSGYVAGRLVKNVDIRTVGDENAGAANVYRNISHKAGIVVAVADIGKGAVAVLPAQILTLESSAPFLCGFAVVSGHNWPTYLKFRGGRGQATTVGVLLMLVPKAMFILLAVSTVPFWKIRNLILTGVILFVPLPLVVWWVGAPFHFIIYCATLPLYSGSNPSFQDQRSIKGR